MEDPHIWEAIIRQILKDYIETRIDVLTLRHVLAQSGISVSTGNYEAVRKKFRERAEASLAAADSPSADAKTLQDLLSKFDGTVQ